MFAARCRLLLVVALWVLLPATVTWGQPPQVAKKPQPKPPALRIPPNVIVERDVEYGRAGDVSLKLDIYRPKQPSEKPRPAIVLIHGGAWKEGTKTWGWVERFMPFVASGHYVCASIDYRLSDVAIWPAQLHDCKAAIRWVRANAKKYNVDPDKIGVGGGSAGGHLVAMLGVSADVPELQGNCGSPGFSSRVTCVFDSCGPSDFSALARLKPLNQLVLYGPASKLLGGPIEKKPEAARSASPVCYTLKDIPPFLIVHGTKDAVVLPEHSELLHAALKKAGVDVTFIKILGGGHGIAPADFPKVMERVEAFFDKHLRGLDVAVSDAPIPAVAAGAAAPGPGPQSDAAGIRVLKDLSYGPYGERNLMDFYLPAPGVGPAAPRPLVICIHGGGWAGGGRGVYAPLGAALARKGFAAVSLTYRFAPQWHSPVQMDDVQRAVRWLRKNAKQYNLDPERVGAIGSSAGGHLASYIALTDTRDDSDAELAGYSSRVQCAVDCYGPVDLVGMMRSASAPIVQSFLGKPLEGNEDHYRRSSPVSYVTENPPPFLILHGTKDLGTSRGQVPIEQSIEFCEKLRQAGGDATLVKVEGAGHGFPTGGPTTYGQQTLPTVIDFFTQHLTGKDARR